MNLSDSEWVTVAVLGRTRGNRGELTAYALSSKPERYSLLTEVFLFGSGERFEVESTWFHQDTLVFKFRGVDTISDAELLSGCEVRVPKSARAPLDPGEFFHSELVGCDVVDQHSGASYGRVTGWLDSGGPGLLEVEGGLLIPFARSICVDIDTDQKRITVELPEGLKDINPR